MVVPLSCIVQGLCGECWEFIQIKLIKVHKGLSKQSASRGFFHKQTHTHLVYLFFKIFFTPYLCLHFNATPVCHSQHVDRHVYGDVHDRNLFSSRFTPDMGNATLLMVTRPHPEKASRAEWEMGWRSCWISSRMSICPSGERQVSLKTICPL